MNDIDRIKDQLDRAFNGKAWHGPAVKEVLEGVDSQAAERRPIAGAHTIWELVHHMAAWTEVVTRRIRGEAAKEPAAGDFPPMSDSSPEAWARSLAWLEDSYNELQEAVATLPDSALEERVNRAVGSSTATVYMTVHGNIQHYLYHAGQIALLKKA